MPNACLAKLIAEKAITLRHRRTAQREAHPDQPDLLELATACSHGLPFRAEDGLMQGFVVRALHSRGDRAAPGRWPAPCAQRAT